MAGKHVGTDKYSTAYTHRPAYPDRVNRAWAEGWNGVQNQHPAGSPAALANAAGGAATVGEEAGTGPGQGYTPYGQFMNVNAAAFRCINPTGLVNSTAVTGSMWLQITAALSNGKMWSAGDGSTAGSPILRAIGLGTTTNVAQDVRDTT
mgnify:CR=1 FL=1